MAEAQKQFHRLYRVGFKVNGGEWRTETVTITDGYSTFEQVRVILAVLIFGDPKRVSEIDVQSVVKTGQWEREV